MLKMFSKANIAYNTFKQLANSTGSILFQKSNYFRRSCNICFPPNRYFGFYFIFECTLRKTVLPLWMASTIPKQLQYYERTPTLQCRVNNIQIDLVLHSRLHLECKSNVKNGFRCYIASHK